MITSELCEKYNIPLPASTWEKHGYEAPAFQRVASGRTYPAPGFKGVSVTPVTGKKEIEVVFNILGVL